VQKDIVEMTVNVGVTKYHQTGRKRTMSNDDIETAWQEGKEGNCLSFGKRRATF